MSRLVDAAFAARPRQLFLPPDQRRHASRDRPLPIGHDATNSQPSTVRRMLELLDARPGDRALDVGCGSGWTTALLAEIVGPDGHVVGTEVVAEVLAQCADSLGDEAGVELHQADPAVAGWPDGAPYDRILLSADAPRMPTELVGQLAPEGTFVGPVLGVMLRIVRHPGAAPQVEQHGHYSFVPLRTLGP